MARWSSGLRLRPLTPATAVRIRYGSPHRRRQKCRRRQIKLVLMTVRVHPFPSRTRQLSSLVPTILGWKRPGKIGRCQHKENSLDFGLGRFSLSSSLFILPVPANSQLNYGAEVNENDVVDVILQMRQTKLCGLYGVGAASSGLLNRGAADYLVKYDPV